MSSATSGIGDRRASVVVLAKDSRFAKTRLGLPSDEARRLAVRLAGSTVRAALAAETVGSVLVVTGDPGIAVDAVGAGAVVVTEPRPLGINRAADLGRRRALELRPHAPVAIIVADLPALRPSDVDAVVTEFLGHGRPLFVADAEGVGTTFLIHGPRRSLGYGFGRGSAAMHVRLGYQPARTSPYALCRDLDTPEDLADLAHLVAPERLVAS
jgi:2-phospho-L-lactate guanylyltransferase